MPHTSNPKLPRLRMEAVLRVRRGESYLALLIITAVIGAAPPISNE